MTSDAKLLAANLRAEAELIASPAVDQKVQAVLSQARALMLDAADALSRYVSLPVRMPAAEDCAGSYASGWNRCLESAMPVLQVSGGSEWRTGWNDCREAIRRAYAQTPCESSA